MPRVICNQIEYIAETGSLLSSLPPYREGASLPCNQKGRCGKCKVRAFGALSPLSEEEKRHLTEEEIRQGLRLACQTRILGDCRLEWEEKRGAQAIQTEGDLPEIDLSPRFKRHGIALDVGTTTLAARLYDLSGRACAEASAMNPQSKWGADVISRIEAAMAGEASAIAQATCSALDSLITTLAREAEIDPDEIDGGVITGNTVMLHLLTETSTEPLSRAPFVPSRLFGQVLSAEELRLHALSPEASLYLPPCISAFVGADITTALLASKLCQSETCRLLIDIGTNGEMALYHQGRLFCCSTAAGPAFEGAGISSGMGGEAGAIDRVQIVNGRLFPHVIGEKEPIGICGSGVIDLVACLLDLEQMDEGGYLEDGSVTLASGVTFTQADLRAVQLAKAAIRAGIEVLMEGLRIKPRELSELVIAGGFGSYLSIPSAIRIGLIPKALSGRIRVIGNAALSGAVMLLLSGDLQGEAERIAREATTLPLSSSPDFAKAYVEGMLFG